MDNLITDLNKYHDEYIKWLKDKTTIKSLGNEWVEITTPHLDQHNDYIQFYVRKDGHGLLLSDGGYIMDDLEAQGVTFNTPKRQKILQELSNGFGVTITKDNQIQTKADSSNFPVRKNNFIQAMLSIHNMFVLAQNSVSNLFYEDVQQWLEESNIRYVEKAKFTGQSGFDFMFDFIIPKTKQAPERLLQVINQPTKNNIEQILFSWLDTKATRPVNSQLFAVLNDEDNQIKSSIKNSLQNYDITPVLWTKKQIELPKLVA